MSVRLESLFTSLKSRIYTTGNTCLQYNNENILLEFYFSYFKIFDASTNKWKLIDEKQHTDVYEKIIEHPVEEDLLYRRNILDETNITNNTERNLFEENLREKHTKTTDSVDYIRSDHLIDESISASDIANQVIITEDVKRKKVSLKIIENS